SEGPTGAGTSTTSGRMVYRDDPDRSARFIAAINSIPALVDFHMEPPQRMAKATVPALLTEHIEHFYKKQNDKLGTMKRTENDSLVKLTFLFRKRPKGVPPGPYLFVNIPKHRDRALSGDMNGDGREDLVLQPVLS